MRLPITLSSPNPKRGFTLIELMVTVAVIAILATIGILVYSQGQKLARDAKRKNDLRQLKNALILYYQDNKAYPTPAAGGCVNSPASVYLCTSANATTPWIAGLTTNYIDNLAKDPLGTNGGDPATSNAIKGYAYRSYIAGVCPNATAAGQVFILYAKLENASDKDTIGARGTTFCNGSVLNQAPNNWPSDIYAVSSYE